MPKQTDITFHEGNDIPDGAVEVLVECENSYCPEKNIRSLLEKIDGKWMWDERGNVGHVEVVLDNILRYAVTKWEE